MSSCCEINAQEEIMRECNLNRTDTCLYCGQCVYLHIREKARDAKEAVPTDNVQEQTTPAVATAIVTPGRQLHEAGVGVEHIPDDAMVAIADFEEANRAVAHRANVAEERDFSINKKGEYPNPLKSKRGMYV